MNVFQIVLFAILGCFTIWLIVDTVIYTVKKVKAKKSKKVEKIEEVTKE